MLIEDQVQDVVYQDLLRLVLRGKDTSTKIQPILKLSRSTISRRLQWLEKHSYLSSDRAFNSKPFRLTKKGRESMSRFLNNQKLIHQSKTQNPLSAHKVTWYFDITKAPYDLRDLLHKNSFMPSTHNTWSKFRRKLYQDAVIVFNPKKVYVYLDEFCIDSPMEYYALAHKKLMAIQQDLENRFPGLVLGKPDRVMVVESNHLVKEYGPLAMKFYEESIKKGEKIVYHGKKLNVDFSKGSPEEETVDKHTAPADLQDLGFFFDRWLESPIYPKELHHMKADINISKQELNEIKETSKQDLNQIKDNLIIQGSSITRMAENNDTFAKAMSEHLILVKSLQEVAFSTKDGMQNMGSEIASQLSNSMIKLGEMMIENQTKTMNQLATKQQQIIEEVEKLSIPWYTKILNKFRKK